jgi:hypothetical protein
MPTLWNLGHSVNLGTARQMARISGGKFHVAFFLRGNMSLQSAIVRDCHHQHLSADFALL